ncbi:export ABC transporter ATP-binding protein [Sporanaerobium hydrogeniformans]|uniref:Export ABC transporter ATP-binding protein n=1 Tax=Sporanaerobium hydrogeniformans TaxID=3072179 RepID=A0AC61DC25_9FIRM|nr:ABC transporter ATP-binding protein [Sporanaerobium hydrogeniformans]PHV70330.1 export ABC transporter ATP-binding protein [Sporanaerobium hydrogeniformans]
MYSVELKGLKKAYGKQIALKELNLKVEQGVIFGLVGPNGAGKSTTIHILSGLLKPDKGEVFIFGEDLKTHETSIKRKLGVVSQELALFENLSAYENVSFFLKLYGIRGKENKLKTEQALEYVGLSDKAKKKAKTFSGGMKRRLHIACAIAHKPQLIIMDEPTVGIDPQSRNHILSTIELLNKEGATVIYTTHYMEEVEAICNPIAIIDHGSLLIEGSKETLKEEIYEKQQISLEMKEWDENLLTSLREVRGIEEVAWQGNVLELTFPKEINCLPEIIRKIEKSNKEIKMLTTKVPNLEDVFLKLTGRTLRD